MMMSASVLQLNSRWNSHFIVADCRVRVLIWSLQGVVEGSRLGGHVLSTCTSRQRQTAQILDADLWLRACIPRMVYSRVVGPTFTITREYEVPLQS